MIAKLFVSILGFPKSDPPDGSTGLVRDVSGKSGLDLQRELAAANRELPGQVVPRSGSLFAADIYFAVYMKAGPSKLGRPHGASSPDAGDRPGLLLHYPFEDRELRAGAADKTWSGV